MEMRTFKLTDNDLTINTDRNIEFISGDGELAQALERTFTTNAGEWFLNVLHGLRYPDIQGKGVTDEAIQMAVIDASLQELRVREVVSIDINRDTPRRTVDIVFHCTAEGGVAIEVPFSF